jgi:hypothetical protein
MRAFRFSKEEESFLRKLDSPSKIQDYLDSLAFNFEKKGETCMSPRRTMREKKAHCIEGGMLACTAFALQGRKPLLLNLKVDKPDDDHVVALFKENGYWGAVSKTNHAVLRYRDPVYKTIRELAMSYFHEYFLVSNGRKTMRGFSAPINLRRFGTKWATSEEDLWNVAEIVYISRCKDSVPKKNKKFLKKASTLERKSASLTA